MAVSSGMTSSERLDPMDIAPLLMGKRYENIPTRHPRPRRLCASPNRGPSRLLAPPGGPWRPGGSLLSLPRVSAPSLSPEPVRLPS